ncbi:uncharacterized protein DMAD_02032 [Drosophila madeirensis]|uniref:Uncharacterized protein n=1 Tax=Drosophila madeirensis TaxID=30013 RepID=A0AAU9G3Q6_DROMD
MDITEKELPTSGQNESTGKRLHVQERTLPGLGLVCRHVELNAQNEIIHATRWAISQKNQAAWQQDDSNDFDIESLMIAQDNLPELEQKKYKDDYIKRWLISQEKHLPQRSTEMPIDELIEDKVENM